MRDGRLNLVGIGGTLRESSTSLGALKRALRTARDIGAKTELLDLRELDLPMYVPGRTLDEYGERAADIGRFLETLRRADAVLISTATYHGTLAGVTKNALDFTQFMARDERPYLEGRVVGLIATAGGDQSALNAIGALTHAAHALRGVVAPVTVAVPRARRISDGAGNITDERLGARLDRLGRLVVDLAARLGEDAEPEERQLAPAAGRR